MPDIATGEEINVTVITVCLNPGVGIISTLESVAYQTYNKIEHVIWDGGSAKSEQRMIRNALHERAVFYSGVDTGIYDAMNRAVGLAKGNYVIFLNAGDLMSNSNVIKELTEIVFKQKALVVCGGVAFFSNDINRLARVWKVRFYRWWLIYLGWMAPHPGLLLSKNLFLCLGGYDTSYKIAGDYDFELRLFKYIEQKKVLPYRKVVTLMELGGASNGSLKKETLKFKEDCRASRSHLQFWLLPVFLKKIKLAWQWVIK